MQANALVCVDTEYMGFPIGRSGRNLLIEFGSHTFQPLCPSVSRGESFVIRRYENLISRRRMWHKFHELTGISLAEIEQGLHPHDAVDKIISSLQNNIIFSWGMEDRRMVSLFLKGYGEEMPDCLWVDMLSEYKRWVHLKQDPSLKKTVKALEVHVPENMGHRAGDDSYMLFLIMNRMWERSWRPRDGEVCRLMEPVMSHFGW